MTTVENLSSAVSFQLKKKKIMTIERNIDFSISCVCVRSTRETS